MLIVGREIGQSVIIGNDIKVTVLQVASKLQLAIDAPKNLHISQFKQAQSNAKRLKNGAKIIVDTTLIGDSIKVTICQTESGLLRFAIDAPREIGIFREELYKGNWVSPNQTTQRSAIV